MERSPGEGNVLGGHLAPLGGLRVKESCVGELKFYCLHITFLEKARGGRVGCYQNRRYGAEGQSGKGPI